MPETINEALARATAQLTETSATARLDACLLLARQLGVTREQLLSSADNILSNNDITGYQALIARRLTYEPIAYITGKKEFWSLDFCVTRDTLIPRPDSETLIEAVLKRAPVQGRAKPITLLDIGTGSGCLLIALLTELPSAEGIGVDNNERALHVAEENAKRLGVTGRAQFVKSHWCDAIHGTFDLILSNPPYIPQSNLQTLMPDVARFEPKEALFAGADGLDAYCALAPQVKRLLSPEGIIMFEVGQGQAEAVETLLKAQGLQTETEQDLGGIARCVVARNIH